MTSDSGDATMNPEPDSRDLEGPEGSPSPAETPVGEVSTGDSASTEGSLAEVVESLDLSDELRAIVQDTRQAMRRGLKGVERGRGEGLARRNLVGEIQLETRGFSVTVMDRDEPFAVRVGRGGLVDAECSCDRFAIEGGPRGGRAPDGTRRLASRAHRGP